MLTLNRIDGCGSDEIYEYVVACQNSMIYGTPAFMELLSTHLSAEAMWIEARQNQEIVGLLPVLIKHGPLGPVFNSLAYYGSNGGVIQLKPDDEVKKALLKQLYQYAEAADALSATVISNPLELDAKFYEDHAAYDFVDERIGQITHFEGKSPDDLMKTFLDPRPRNIKKALREGIEVSTSNEKVAMEFLYQTHVDNMKAIGGQPKQRDFFDAVLQKIDRTSWKIFTASKDGMPIAALLVFYFNRTVEYFCPVVLEEFRSSQSLSLIIFTAMKEAINDGFQNWNWGGTWLSQGGVYDFKRRWGTTEYAYYYFTKVFKQQVLIVPKEDLLRDYRGFFVLPFSALNRAIQ